MATATSPCYLGGQTAHVIDFSGGHGRGTCVAPHDEVLKIEKISGKGQKDPPIIL